MTAFSEIYDKFYELVETDSNFFQYFDLNENEVRNLVHGCRLLQVLPVSGARKLAR